MSPLSSILKAVTPLSRVRVKLLDYYVCTPIGLLWFYAHTPVEIRLPLVSRDSATLSGANHRKRLLTASRCSLAPESRGGVATRDRPSRSAPKVARSSACAVHCRGIATTTTASVYY